MISEFSDGSNFTDGGTWLVAAFAAVDMSETPFTSKRRWRPCAFFGDPTLIDPRCVIDTTSYHRGYLLYGGRGVFAWVKEWRT
jgi:hypothetical protein